MSEDQIRDLLHQAAGDPGEPPTEGLLRAVRRRRTRRRIAVRGTGTVAVAVAAVLAVTSSGVVAGGGPHPTGAPGLTLAADLATYSSCDALLADLKSRAEPLVGPYGLQGQQFGNTFDGAGGALSGTAASVGSAASGSVAPGSAPAPAAGPAPGPQSLDDALPHSTTTDRTRGVDEPDITKTDGHLLVTLEGGVLRVYDAVHPALLGKLALADSSQSLAAAGSPGLLLTGDRAVVTGLAPLVRQSDARGASALAVVDLSNPAAPKLTRLLTVDGDLVDDRLVNGLPRLVTHAAPPTLHWFTPTDGSTAAQAAATARNKAVLQASSITDWLPTYALTDGAGKALGSGRLFGCDAVVHDTAPTDGADLVGTTAFDPQAATGPVGGLAVVGAGDTAYVAGTHLFIATGRGGGGFQSDACFNCFGGVFPATAGPSPMTQVHGFDLTDRAHTRSLGSATLPGRLLGDQAINENGPVVSVLLSHGGPEPGEGTQDTSLVDLREGNGALTQVGGLTSLSAEETFQSARWIGTTCYLVTFRQRDPLVVIDLADPAKPRVRATLPSADTSTYLLQADTGRLLGVGNADNGVTAKLYGVDDIADPQLLATASIPGGGSAAVSDPHALLYWRAGRLLFLPMYDGTVQVTTVDRDALTHRLTLSQKSHTGKASPNVDRVVLIGRDAWTVSARGVLVSDLAGGADVAWLPS